MINFYNETDFILKDKENLISWIEKIIRINDALLDEINYIFCNDNYLLKINQDFLEHDYFTDIITFDNSIGNTLSADIYISIDRVIDNAKIFDVHFDNELRRVLIHGILHLLGYKDKTKDEQSIMTKLENDALALYI